MYVGSTRFTVAIDHAHSLKEKRAVLRRARDRARERLGVVIAEVGEPEVHQRALLGASVTSGDHGKVIELLDSLSRLLTDVDGLRVFRIEREVHRFGDGSISDSSELDGAAFAETPGATAPWIPSQWEEAMENDE